MQTVSCCQGYVLFEGVHYSCCRMQELEDTISSLRQQVRVLQQRVMLLQEDTEIHRSLPHVTHTPQADTTS